MLDLLIQVCPWIEYSIEMKNVQGGGYRGIENRGIENRRIERRELGVGDG
jgi:hypothetical protein